MTWTALRWSRLLAAAILLLIAGFAILGPALIGVDPAEQNLLATLSPPGQAGLLGTDHLGRSVLARLAEAAQISFLLALLSVLSAAITGSALGLAAAWWGGWAERILVAMSDMVLAIPGILLIFLLIAFAPGAFWLIYVGISLTLWVEYFRIVRATSRRVLHGPQVQSSRLLGFGSLFVIRRHVLPEIMPLILTLMAFGGAASVLAVASLGYLNIGVRQPTAELGQMMSEYFPYYQDAPWLVAMPILLLTVSLLCLAALTSSEKPE